MMLLADEAELGPTSAPGLSSGLENDVPDGRADAAGPASLLSRRGQLSARSSFYGGGYTPLSVVCHDSSGSESRANMIHDNGPDSLARGPPQSLSAESGSAVWRRAEGRNAGSCALGRDPSDSDNSMPGASESWATDLEPPAAHDGHGHGPGASGPPSGTFAPALAAGGGPRLSLGSRVPVFSSSVPGGSSSCGAATLSVSADSLVVKDLAAYAPELLWRTCAAATKNADKPLAASQRTLKGVIMLADICKFSSLTSTMETSMEQGAWATSAVLNQLFSVMAAIIRQHGGDIIRFAGDALLVLWEAVGGGEDSEAEQRGQVLAATRCARELLAIERAAVPSPQHGTAELELHIAIDIGMCTAMVLGGLNGCFEFLLTGEFFAQFGPLLAAASRGEVVVSGAIWDILQGSGSGDHPTVIGQRVSSAEVEATAMGAMRVDSIAPQQPLEGSPSRYDSDEPETNNSGPGERPHWISRRASLQLSDASSDNSSFGQRNAATTAAVRCFLPAVVVEHHDAGQHAWFAENRQVSTVFIGLPSLGAGQFLLAQELMTHIQAVAHRWQGMIRQLITDDKGTVCILVWGCPPSVLVDGPLRAARAAVELCKALTFALDEAGRSRTDRDHDTISMGITTGRAFCGNVGSVERCEYSILGNSVNMAARLMGVAHARGGGVVCDEATSCEFMRTGRSGPGVVCGPAFEVVVKGSPKPLTVAHLLLKGVLTGPSHKTLMAFPSEGHIGGRAVPRRSRGGSTGSALAPEELFVGRDGEFGGLVAQMRGFVDRKRKSFEMAYAAGQGLGKSSMLRASARWLLREAPDIGICWLLGDEVMKGLPWYAFQTPWMLRLTQAGLPLLSDRLRPYASLLREVAPDLLVGEETAVAKALEGDARLALVIELVLTIIRLTTENPVRECRLALLVDDAHNMDNSSLRLLTELHRCALPIIILMAYRPHTGVPSMHARVGDDVIPSSLAFVQGTLPHLSQAATEALVCGTFDIERMHPKLGRAIHDMAGGIPLLVKELCSLLRKNGYTGATLAALQDVAGISVLSEVMCHGTKSSVSMEAMVTSLVDAQSMLARAAIKCASVLGNEFLLSAVLQFLNSRGEPVDSVALQTAAEELVADALWEPVWAGRYKFHHSMIRHVVYSLLIPQDQRIQFHLCCLRQMEANLLQREAENETLHSGSSSSRSSAGPGTTAAAATAAAVVASANPAAAGNGRRWRLSLGIVRDKLLRVSLADLARHAEGAQLHFEAATYFLMFADEASAAGSVTLALTHADRGLASLEMLGERGPHQPHAWADFPGDGHEEPGQYTLADSPEARRLLHARLLGRKGDYLFMSERSEDGVPLLLAACASAGQQTPDAAQLSLAVVRQECIAAMYVHRPDLVVLEAPEMRSNQSATFQSLAIDYELSVVMYAALLQLSVYYLAQVGEPELGRWAIAHAFNLAHRLAAVPLLAAASSVKDYATTLALFVMRHPSPRLAQRAEQCVDRPDIDEVNRGSALVWVASGAANAGDLETHLRLLGRISSADCHQQEKRNCYMKIKTRLVSLLLTGHFGEGLKLSEELLAWAKKVRLERGLRWSNGQIARFVILSGDVPRARELLPAVVDDMGHYELIRAQALEQATEGVWFAGLMLLGDTAGVAAGLARAFARGFVLPQDSTVAFSLTLTLDAAMTLADAGLSVPGFHLIEEICKLLQHLWVWAERSAFFFPIMLYLRGRQEALLGDAGAARRFFALAAQKCASMGLIFYEGRVRFELRKYGGTGQLEAARRLFAASGAMAWVAAADAALADPAAAGVAEGPGWDTLSWSETSAMLTQIPCAATRAQIYEARGLRLQLCRLAALFEPDQTEARSAIESGLLAAWPSVLGQLCAPPVGSMMAQLLLRLEADLPSIGGALLLGGAQGGRAADDLIGVAVEEVMDADGAASPSQCTCFLGCGPEKCAHAFALAAVCTLVATTLLQAGVSADAGLLGQLPRWKGVPLRCVSGDVARAAPESQATKELSRVDSSQTSEDWFSMI